MTEIRTRKQYAGRVWFYVLILILFVFLISMIIMFTRKNPAAIYRKNSNMRVEVLNGCGVNRLGIKAANTLRKRGFNVVKIGDTLRDDFEETVVLERSDENMKNAKYFANQIGCKNIGKDIDAALFLEITIIIGKDYRKVFPDAEKEF